jgi:hypothetical protein
MFIAGTFIAYRYEARELGLGQAFVDEVLHTLK